MIVLIHGDEEFLRAEALASLKAELGQAELADLNVSWLEGSRLELAELRHACEVLPFLADRRLVIVENLIAGVASGRRSKRARKPRQTPPASSQVRELLKYLPQVPATTDLALIERQTVRTETPLFQAMTALAREGRGRIIHCATPAESALPSWIRQRAQHMNVPIEPDAAKALALAVGPHLRQLVTELEKLAAYAGEARSIRTEDVQLLVASSREANVFRMVEAISHRDTATALTQLRGLLDAGEHPLGLLEMIIRQYRLIVQTKELAQKGMNQYEIAREIRQRPYPVGKALQQARHYSFAQLEAIYERLLDTDVAIKTGHMADTLALELLVVELGRY